MLPAFLRKFNGKEAAAGRFLQTRGLTTAGEGTASEVTRTPDNDQTPSPKGRAQERSEARRTEGGARAARAPERPKGGGTSSTKAPRRGRRVGQPDRAQRGGMRREGAAHGRAGQGAKRGEAKGGWRREDIGEGGRGGRERGRAESRPRPTAPRRTPQRSDPDRGAAGGAGARTRGQTATNARGKAAPPQFTIVNSWVTACGSGVYGGEVWKFTAVLLTPLTGNSQM